MVGCWHGYLSGARCRFANGPADTTATHCLLLQEIQTGFGFTFLVVAHPDSPGQNPESRKMVVVVVLVVSAVHIAALNKHLQIMCIQCIDLLLNCRLQCIHNTQSFYCSSGICPGPPG